MTVIIEPPVTKTGAPFVTGATQKCARCKRAMAPRIYPGTPKRFCSTKCRMAAHRKAARDMRPNEFYTPSHIIELARASMGGIDLDPASCELANETVGATRFYDIKQDGLKRPWFGNIFLNPPYSRFGPPFVRKAVEEFKSARIKQAIILLNVNHIATHWFNDAMQVEHLVCLPRKRINHTSPIHITSSPTSASVLIGIGVDRERFIEHFGPLGRIAFVPQGGQPCTP